jgi:site-specific recombinase XerD
VRDYKKHLKEQQARPTTVNIALAAIDHFYRFLGMGDAKVRREDLPQQSPRGLEPEEQIEFLRAIERCGSKRDQALGMLLFYTGLRVSECASLNFEDVRISARKGIVIVRSGKGDTYREIPLNSQARAALDAWLQERRTAFSDSTELALFLNQSGGRLSTRSIDIAVRKLGQSAGLELSSHVLRHTCLTNLIRRGHDLVLVAEVAGHKRLETTRRYSLPSEKDRAAAMDDIEIDY